jgi:hypothetical protein
MTDQGQEADPPHRVQNCNVESIGEAPDARLHGE